MSDKEAPEKGDGGGGTALHYSLAIFYLLMSVFTIILSWIIPSIPLSASVTFTLVGCIIFIGALLQVVYTSELAATLCGSCPPPIVS